MLVAGKRFVKQRLRGPLSDLYWRVYGNTLRNPAIGARPAAILFVCMGNICRSPFAERIARRIFVEAETGELGITSAGIAVSGPFPPPEFAISAGRRFGIDLEDHRSGELTEVHAVRSDMILVMEPGHLLALRARFPAKRESMFLLPLFDDHRHASRGIYRRYNIPDPYGHDMGRFVDCYEQIARCVRGLAAAVAGRNPPALR